MREVSRFVIGDVLKTSLWIYSRNLPTVVVLAAIASAPMFAVAWLALGDDMLDSTGRPDGLWTIGDLFAAFLGGFWLEAGMAFAVVRTLRSAAPSLGETLAYALQVIPRVLVVGLVAYLFVGLGFVALIVPGIILILVYWVVVPVAAVERGGVVYALKRSHELTKGHKGRILAILGLLLIPVIPSIIAGDAGAGIPWALGLDWSEATLAQATVVVDALILSVECTVVAVCYHDLRVLKDGYDSGRIAEVFA